MKLKQSTLVLFALLAISNMGFTQPDTEDFPDFTYNDIEGVEQNLYSYLDDGKIVIIDVFTTWCPNCVNSLPALEEIWEAHGPAGDNTVMIISFERDANTSNEAEFADTHNITNPIITGAEDLVANTWNVPYQPYYFVICPDRSHQTHIGAVNTNADIITDLFEGCSEAVGIDEIREDGEDKLILHNRESNLVLNGIYTDDKSYRIFDMGGVELTRGKLTQDESLITINQLSSGMYILLVETGGKVYSDRFVK